MIIVLKNCIKLDTPTDEGETGCDCYKRYVSFLYDFRFYGAEVCRGWFDYMYKTIGYAPILNKILENCDVENPNICHGYPGTHKGTEYFIELCSFDPEYAINYIPIVDLLENPYEYVCRYWESIRATHLDKLYKGSIDKCYDLKNRNLYYLERIIQPGFIKKDIRKQLEILVKELRKTIRNVRSDNSE